jgi:hypothetical protein
MKRYLIFAGGYNNPYAGGWSDLQRQFNDLEEAKIRYSEIKADIEYVKGLDWIQLVDLDIGQIIEQYS